MQAEQQPLYIIANPASGNGKAARVIPKIKKYFQDIGRPVTLVHTTRSGNAQLLAQEAAQQGIPVIVAAGGDGTINEVINGLMSVQKEQRSRTTLGVIPIGRGNDFAAGLGLSDDWQAACQVLLQGSTTQIDLGQVFGGIYPEGRYFGNCVGIGFDAVGTIEAAKLPQIGGFLSYLIAVLKTIFLYYKGPVVEILLDDQRLVQSTLLVSVMNGRRIGGGFIMAPNATLDDGWLDLCIADQVPRRRIFTLVPHFMRGTQGTQAEIKTGRARQIVIRAVQGGLPAQTDGEILCVDGSELRVEILPQTMPVLKPAAAQ